MSRLVLVSIKSVPCGFDGYLCAVLVFPNTNDDDEFTHSWVGGSRSIHIAVKCQSFPHQEPVKIAGCGGFLLSTVLEDIHQSKQANGVPMRGGDSCPAIRTVCGNKHLTPWGWLVTTPQTGQILIAPHCSYLCMCFVACPWPAISYQLDGIGPAK